MSSAGALRPVVVKIGGAALATTDTSLDDIATLFQQGIPLVVVHGGGVVISQWMQRSGAMPRFIRGLRVTDPPTLEVVVAVLAGLVNKQIVAALQAKGVQTLGLSGADGLLLQAQQADPELGLVGKVVAVNPAPVLGALQQGYLPVVAPIGIGVRADGGCDGLLLNINGDTAAGALAKALHARLLVFLTDVEGVLDGAKRLLPRLLPQQARALMESGVVAGGMIPKIEACLDALATIPKAVIADGRRPHTLVEVVHGASLGTLIG
ncbi:MAG: acetylglutamate kinase [Dehalococcoidia bacterium]|nr:acetylglutamate kinase [Dehalococcoidia bacterium]MDW8119393.1 acetylglutamate kinase [Chloroflexota bacterium]